MAKCAPSKNWNGPAGMKPAGFPHIYPCGAHQLLTISACSYKELHARTYVRRCVKYLGQCFVTEANLFEPFKDESWCFATDAPMSVLNRTLKRKKPKAFCKIWHEFSKWLHICVFCTKDWSYLRNYEGSVGPFFNPRVNHLACLPACLPACTGKPIID